MVQGLTIQQEIGQRLVAGLPGLSIDDDFKNLIKTYKIGNVILFARNIASVDQVKTLCSDLKKLILEETGYVPFIGIDQEGGMVTRLSEDATNIPGAMAIAATGNPQFAYQGGLITARELKALGMNFNFAPVLDVNSNSENPVIGVRSYADNPETVIQYGLAMMRGLMEGGIICAAKHFPGHGDTSLDSHLSLPSVDRNVEELRKIELAPFVAAIKAGIPAIMTTHILFPSLEPKELPATMSRAIITNLLKKSMGFNGLVVSDCMEMAAIQQYYGTVNGTIGAMQAGVDLILISHTASLAAQAAQAVQTAILNGSLHSNEMDESVDKIIASKKSMLVGSDASISIVGGKEHRQKAKTMLQASITLVHTPQNGLPPLGDNPWFLGCRAYRATNASNMVDPEFSFANHMARLCGGKGTTTSINPLPDEIEDLMENQNQASCIVVGTYNGHLNKGQLELVKALALRTVPVVVVALRNPYDLQDLPHNVSSLAAYEYSANCFDAIAKVLKQEIQATGKLKVSL
jgi:beta-N-acetylhexosaminidase